MQFSFQKPHFWHPPNFAKTLFWHTVALFVFLKMPKKHYKTGEKQWKKNLDQFLTLNLDQFLTLKPPNLGPVFNFTAYIYIYVFVFFFGGQMPHWTPTFWGLFARNEGEMRFQSAELLGTIFPKNVGRTNKGKHNENTWISSFS